MFCNTSFHDDILCTFEIDCHGIVDMSLGQFWRFIGSYFRTRLVLFDPSYPVAPDQRNKRRHAPQKKTFYHCQPYFP